MGFWNEAVCPIPRRQHLCLPGPLWEQRRSRCAPGWKPTASRLLTLQAMSVPVAVCAAPTQLHAVHTKGLQFTESALAPAPVLALAPQVWGDRKAGLSTPSGHLFLSRMPLGTPRRGWHSGPESAWHWCPWGWSLQSSCWTPGSVQLGIRSRPVLVRQLGRCSAAQALGESPEGPVSARSHAPPPALQWREPRVLERPGHHHLRALVPGAHVPDPKRGRCAPGGHSRHIV